MNKSILWLFNHFRRNTRRLWWTKKREGEYEGRRGNVVASVCSLGSNTWIYSFHMITFEGLGSTGMSGFSGPIVGLVKAIEEAEREIFMNWWQRLADEPLRKRKSS